MPKLTLNADKDVIAKAKRIAQDRGISASEMFSQFILSLRPKTATMRRAAPITKKLRGIAKAPSSKSDRELLEDAMLSRGSR